MIKHLSLKAYGKINLGLDVLRRREDGYHDVRMIMQTVGIFDRVDLVRKEEPGIEVETNLYYLPTNENNLVYKAAKLLMDEFQVQEGIQIRLRKFIPVAAGMAGGSSDAAAVLFGVNKMFRLGMSTEQLMERGVRIGADVPYCILRGTALSEGIGEVLTKLPAVPQCQVLVAKPGINVSTKFVYENLHANDLRPEQHPDIDGMIQAIKDQDLKKIAGKLGNVLETVTVKEYPVIQEIKDKMLEFGAIGSLMSGSGPTVFGLFTNPKAAQEAYEELRYGESAELAKQVYLTNFYNQKEEKNHGTRKTQIKTWVYPAFRRLCHRHRKRMEIPLHGRPGRRRRVRAVLSAVPGHLGPAHHEHGVCSGPRQPQESGARLSGTGKAGPEMAHPRLLCPHWLLLADDVLHHRGRLDDALLLHDGCGQALRPDRG